MRQSERSRRQGSSVFPVGEVGWSRKWHFGQAFRSERPFGGGLETEVSASVGEVGQSRKRAPFHLGQAFRSERPFGGGLEITCFMVIKEAK